MGLTRAVASAAVAMLGVGNLAGRTGGGWLSDHIGRLPALRAATATLAAACLVLVHVAGATPVLAIMTIVGMAYGVQAALVPAATADLFGTMDFAANFGRVFTGWGIAGLLGPQVGARLGDATHGFTAALRLGAVSAALAFALYVLLTRVRERTTVPGTSRSRAL